MNFRFTVLETSLNRAEFRWKWLRFVQHTSVLGIVLCGLMLALGLSIWAGWLTSRTLAYSLLGLLCAGGFIAWMVVIISVMASTPDRQRLASAVERVDRRFLDRLNTLLFLERRKGERPAEAIALRIARQAQSVIAEHAPPAAFSSRASLKWFGLFACVMVGLLLLNRTYSPWHLLAANTSKPRVAKGPEKPLDLALPPTNHVEQNRSWGEVRITDPGMDLKVTKVDVVPLQIEAAANQPIKEVHWLSTVNGAKEADNPLPPPAEPRYGVFHPTIYLDELNLSDWDVMTYYARANTEPKHSYASEVYFLEVRPFREDILKMPGGEGGKAYQTLSALSGLINRQQHIIRQTHQHLQQPPEQEAMRTRDRNKLGDAEHDVGDSTQHLYAKMAAEMENKPIGDALDNLAKAETSLESAGQNLHNNVMPEAQNNERQALSELVAARKMFQKAVSDNAGAFEDQNGEDQEPPPVADQSSKLNRMAEFRNEAKAAREFVQKTVEQQRDLERRARTSSPSQYSKLSDQERELRENLANFQQQHPRVFKGTEAESSQAQKSMKKAADSLQNRSVDARSSTSQATRDLEQFGQKMDSQATSQQLADAYKLKQMLDQQVKKFDQRSKPDSKMSDEELQKTVEEAKKTVEQLRNTAEQEPTKDAFGQPLRDALSGQNKVDLDAKLRKLEAAEGEQAKQQAAGEAGKKLGNVSQAFAASEPKSLQMARENDSLKPSDKDSFAQGMAELDSLIKQLEDNRELSKDNQGKQGRQALADLQNGMRSQFGDNEAGNQILRQLEQRLKGESSPDIGDLKKLMDSLQHFSVETSEQLAKKEDQPEVSNIDPAHLPPAYRSRIQKYFQKLSER